MTSKLAWSMLLCVGLLTACNTPQPIDGMPRHHTTDGFQNLHSGPSQASPLKYLIERYFGDNVWADHAALADTVPYQEVAVSQLTENEQEIQITWLGHCTFLIQMSGVTILTDPVFSDRASPVSFVGPKRYGPHVMNYADLPKIDLVVISHDHYDHLDKHTISLLGNSTNYAVPLNLSTWFIENGIDENRIIEFDWWDTKTVENIKIQASPSQHWSGRWMTKKRYFVGKLGFRKG